MAKKSKRYTEAAALIENGKLYSAEEAIELVKKTSNVKFDASVDVAFNLGLDVRQADQQLRGAVVLPHGTGKTKKVLVVAEGEKAQEAKDAGADYLIAIGGGSPQDTCKGIGIILANPEFEDVISLEGVAPTKNKSVPVIAIATTAGTAAETTINYVITDTEKKRKFVCVDAHDIPVVAIIDPEMMSSMPKGLTASTGLDALTHAIEGYTTLAAWELADTLNLKAIEIISRSLRAACENDPKGREDMALGQYMTGMAFSNVGLGVDHGMAHPLSAFYGIPHGVACATLLPYVMEFNKDYTGEKFREIARVMGVEGVDEMSQEEYRQAAIDAVIQLSKDCGIAQSLKEIGVKEEDLPTLTDSAMADVCTGGNPRPCTKELIFDLYKYAFNGRD